MGSVDPLFREIDHLLDGLVRALQPDERRRLAWQVAKGLRVRQQKRITRQQSPDGSAWPARKPRLRHRNGRKTKMFLRLRTARFLKASASADTAIAGFAQRAALIASVHQHGEESTVARRIRTRYPVRELLGIAESDEDWIAETVIGFLQQKVV